ncbi:MAG: hypothetical protein KDB60_01645 [Propionibacteriaceae bacterium]|nr:hypothetical protein [Propionibacteriaceae bacterium]
MPDTSGPTTTPAGPSAASYGVGARVSLYPMCDDYVDVILGALADTPVPDGVTTATSPVSTFAGGPEDTVVPWLADLVAAATRRADGAHLAAAILLSRGCPGEVSCELASGPWASDDSVDVPGTGIEAWADWSLYPLPDGARAPGDHMEPIMAAVESARESGLYHSSDHYVTRLRGDVGAILALVATAWLGTGSHVQHVVTHLTMSINSPTQGDPS